ncbi:MAG: hypothetical protein OHK0013_38610 [Sandaracinaceae bacterium]
MLASFASTWALSLGCDHREVQAPPRPPDQRSGRASDEPVRLQRGRRVVEVHCELACGPAQVELSRLQRGCVRDPSSNVHHVSERPAMIHLGCCAEAEGLFTEACGAEGTMSACVSRWAALCQHGTLLESLEPTAFGEGPT